jgi:ATP/maltotriose-dependent transcriptional regulator MalT
MTSSGDHLAAGQRALDTADWARAAECFEAALREHDTPEAHAGLGLAFWWLNQIPAAHEHRAAAYLGFKRRGDLRRAAMLAAWLGREQVFLAANTSAMHGWFTRSERLLSQSGRCVEQGWCLLLRASMVADAATLERSALEAIALAHEFADADLEVMALAFCGLARVVLGRVAEGMATLDEAMAVALGGEIGSFTAISEIFCVMLSACELAGDLMRTEQWCQAAAEFARRYNCSFLSAYCRTSYGGLLTAVGRWSEADAELSAAIRAFETGHRALRVHAVLKLADLRVCQGRLEEAAALLAGHEDHEAAAVPLARLHLARGEAALARATLEQALLGSQPPTLHVVPQLSLLVDVLIAGGDLDAAQQAVERLAHLARKANSAVLLAQAELASGKLKRAVGEQGAASAFQSALEQLRPYQHSLLAGRARLEMARLLLEDDRAAAITWARAAYASFTRIGATHDADQAAELLRRLGAPARAGARSQERLTQREAEVLSLIARGLTNREIAERLVVSAKTVEHHVGQVLSKLGARSRAEAAALAIGGGADIGERPIAWGEHQGGE